jgi:hypothetical protein
MLCPRCGTNNLETNLLCTQCANPLERAPAAPVPPALDLDGIPMPTGMARSTAPQTPPLYQAPPSVAPRPTEVSAPGWQTPQAPTFPQPGVPASRPPLPHFGSLATAPLPAQPMMACGVCGTAIFPGQPKCLRCQTPPGYIIDPNDPTATNFLPFGPPVALKPLFRMGEEQSGEAPGDMIRGWNWGAALMPTIWAARHRFGWQAGVSGLLSVLLIGLYLLRAALHRTPDASGTLTGFLVICVLIFGVPRSLYAGLRGNSLAWRSGLYADRDSLQKTHRSWTTWAIIGVALLALLLGVIAGMLNAA